MYRRRRHPDNVHRIDLFDDRMAIIGIKREWSLAPRTGGDGFFVDYYRWAKSRGTGRVHYVRLRGSRQ